MFQKIRRSLRDHRTSPAADNLLDCEQHICHACGQHMTRPFEDGDDFLARPYELYEANEPRDRDSWNSSNFSDSGYGSFSSSQKAESLLQLGGPCTQSTIIVRPPSRRSTYTISTYSNEDDLEDLSPIQVPAESAQMQPTEYQHLFDLPARTSTRTSQSWKPKSRYARLNELPAASPGALRLNHNTNTWTREEETKSGKKKRTIQYLESLLSRPSSLGRLNLRRTRNETQKR